MCQRMHTKLGVNNFKLFFKQKMSPHPQLKIGGKIYLLLLCSLAAYYTLQLLHKFNIFHSPAVSRFKFPHR